MTFLHNKIQGISLDTVLLFFLGIANLWTAQQVIPDNYSILFINVFFVLFFLYILVDLLVSNSSGQYELKVVLLALLITFFVVGYMVLLMYLRHSTDSHRYVHDNILQVEAGIQDILKGKNPYSEEYFGTPQETMFEGKFFLSGAGTVVNPALYHYISLPFYTLFSAPFYVIFTRVTGWYDQRVAHLFVWLLSLVVIFHIPKQASKKLLFLLLFSLNPLFFNHLTLGTNDVFVLFWIAVTFFCLQRQKFLLSSVVLALAFTSKHSAFFLAPFYFFYLYWVVKSNASTWGTRLKILLKKIFPFFVICAIIFGFFAWWDFSAFWEDIYLYPAGKIKTSFPIFGSGFSALIFSFGVVRSQLDYFPFWYFQLIFGLPLLALLLYKQRMNNVLSVVALNFGMLLFVFWYFSRFFNQNYMGFLSMIFLFSYFLQERPQSAEPISP